MRISDWSSDVCSSDLRDYVFEGGGSELRAVAVTESSLGILRSERLEPDDAPAGLAVLPAVALESLRSPGLIDINKANARSTVHRETGRASCRERGCQYV